jgi:hypothetical protein
LTPEAIGNPRTLIHGTRFSTAISFPENSNFRAWVSVCGGYPLSAG